MPALQKEHVLIPDPATPDRDPLMSPAGTAAFLSVSISTLRRLVRSGVLPAALVISPNRRAWRRSVIERYAATRPSSR